MAAITGCLALLAAGIVRHYRANHAGQTQSIASNPGTSAHYVGAARCASCHAHEYATWRNSQHQLAMQYATPQTVLGSFDRTTYQYAGTTSSFYQRAGQYFVSTDGPDGRLHDYRIQYTFGVTPLQQYLIAMPGGRLQALSIAWDTRPREQGGQRWFHLYPGQAIKAGDRLHWTGIDQNWNYQCADCHSTHLLKNFDVATNAFRTTWSDINVACEACHGPGSAHLDWATKKGDWQHVPDKGLSAKLDERRNVTWTRSSGEATAVRSVLRAGQREIDTCAHCHARRGQLSDDYSPGHPLVDSYRPALLQDGLYWPDGQMRGEVYNYASFLQSKMYAHGVTCGDCHEPHSLQLRAPGNLVCAQCHDPSRFDSDHILIMRPEVPAHSASPATCLRRPICRLIRATITVCAYLDPIGPCRWGCPTPATNVMPNAARSGQLHRFTTGSLCQTWGIRVLPMLSLAASTHWRTRALCY